jgi:hypothetical protein
VVVIRQDVGQVMQFTVVKDGQEMNLTAAVITLLVSNGLTLALSIFDAVGGVCGRTSVGGDFPNAGVFQGVLQIVQAGKTLNSQPFVFIVRDIFS